MVYIKKALAQKYILQFLFLSSHLLQFESSSICFRSISNFSVLLISLSIFSLLHLNLFFHENDNFALLLEISLSTFETANYFLGFSLDPLNYILHFSKRNLFNYSSLSNDFADVANSA